MLNLVNYLFYPTECAEIDVISVSTARSSRDLAIVQQSPERENDLSFLKQNFAKL